MSHRSFPVLSPLHDGATCVGCASSPRRGTQLLTWAPLLQAVTVEGDCVVLGYCPGTVWGSHSMRHPSPLLGMGKSGAPRVSRTASGDAGLEAHESQPRQTPSTCLGQRRRVLDPPPGHESAWKDIKNGDSTTIYVSGHGCFARIEVSLFDL